MVKGVAKAGSKKLDGIAGAAEQEIWLATSRPVPMHRLRRADRGEQGKYLAEYESLSHAERWPALRRVLKTYLERCIFEPFATEGEFWSTTCKPGFVRVNLHGQETFGAGVTEDGEVVYWLHARKSLLDPLRASEEKLFENFHFVEAFDGKKRLYKAGGEDQIRLETVISKEKATSSGTAADAKIELSEQARLFMAWHRCEHGYGNCTGRLEAANRSRKKS